METVDGDLIVLIFANIIVVPLIFFIAWLFGLELGESLAFVAMFVSISTSIYTISKIPKKDDDRSPKLNSG